MEMPFCYGKRLSNSLWKSFAHDWLVLLCSWNIFRDRMKNFRSIIMAKWNFCVMLCWFETCIFPCLVILKKTCLGYKSIMHRDISEFDFISSVFSGFKSCISDMIKTHSLFRMSLPTIEVIQFLGNRFFLPVSSNMFFASTRVKVPKLLWMFFLFRFFFFLEDGMGMVVACVACVVTSCLISLTLLIDPILKLCFLTKSLTLQWACDLWCGQYDKASRFSWHFGEYHATLYRKGMRGKHRKRNGNLTGNKEKEESPLSVCLNIYISLTSSTRLTWLLSDWLLEESVKIKDDQSIKGRSLSEMTSIETLEGGHRPVGLQWKIRIFRIRWDPGALEYQAGECKLYSGTNED